MAVVVSAPPEQGQLVTVRQRRYIVTDVAESTLPDRPLKVSGNGAQVIEKVALPEPSGFDEPERLDAFLDAVRWGAATPALQGNIAE